MRYHHGWFKRAKMKKTDHRGLCGNENSHTLLVGVKSGVATLADSVTVPYKHTHVPAIRPVTPLLGIFATEMKAYVYTHVFRVALFVRTKTVDWRVSAC